MTHSGSGVGSGFRGLKHKEFSTADLTSLGLDADRDGEGRSTATQQIDSYVIDSEQASALRHQRSLLPDVLDLSPALNDAAAALVDDSFLRCFKSCPPDPWNWNVYLFPLWCLGVVVRHCVLFPIRLAVLLLGFVVFLLGFAVVGLALKGQQRRRAERWLVQFLCQMFVVSWTGVVKYHGPRPVARPGHVWVANHTSMIDYAVLCAYSPFAVIMQLHPGWVGVIQRRYLNALGCLWFNRTQAQDRALVAQRMREHVHTAGNTPLLIFPEGTCVNNDYCVMFKRGAFDLGATVCPVAIKYNKIFVDAFWNSKRQSFSAHLGKLMRSWALVCDVYFLEPQQRRLGEGTQAFAERVQRMIAERGRLKVAPWDGYLKYYNLGEKHPDLIEKQRKVYSQIIQQHVDKPTPTAPAAHE